MLHFPGKIPISIHPFFWVLAGLIGWLNSGTLFGTLIWIGIILVSVLVHELGHALTALAFGKSPRIELIALGGVTIYRAERLKFWQQFLITLNGPLFGFGLFLLASFILIFDFSSMPFLYSLLKTFQVINLFWTIVNLLPVLPLDGGQLLRIALEAFFGVKGFRISLFIGMLVSVLISFFFFLIQGFLIGALFFLFAFQSFDMWRKSRFITSTDRNESNTDELLQAEQALKSGNKAQAKALFEDIRQKSKEGLLYVAATQYLALLLAEEEDNKRAYEMLVSIKEQLSEGILCLLHRLAFEMGNFTLVAELSSTCYQIQPTQEIALKNARAFASLQNARPAAGWLQTAWQYGGMDVEKIISEEVFGKVKGDPEFQSLIKQIQS
jgi:stage IV sporulation protein FB